MKRFTVGCCLCIIMLVFPICTIAETYITENITQDTTWTQAESPYIISGTIQIYPGITLRIEPGAVVKFYIDASLIIGGELIARGTPENRILFTSNAATPSPGDWINIEFKGTATSAKYKPGYWPQFVYDYDNHQIILEYDSGSILEYCDFEYGGKHEYAIRATEGSFPCIMHCSIRNCESAALCIDGDKYWDRWFFLHDNIIQSGSNFNMELNSLCLVSGNMFQSSVSFGGGIGIAPLFINNQILNTGTGLYSGDWMTFLEHNVIAHNAKGLHLRSKSLLIHNYIAENQSYGGVDIERSSMLFNNTIQLNGVRDGGHGDGIRLLSSNDNKYIIRRNNLGNSIWDMQEIYADPNDDENCDDKNQMIVDATENSWMTDDPPAHIYDYNDDMCAGTVIYEPMAASPIIPTPLATHPTLIAPQNNAYFQSSNNYVSFSWNPVNGADRYILVYWGRGYLGAPDHQMVEVRDGTSKTIQLPDIGGDWKVRWFVIAGNENGWSLPSEVRYLTVSNSQTILSGRILDEYDHPVARAFIQGRVWSDKSAISDDEGNYSLIMNYNEGWGDGNYSIFKITKDGYPTCYTFPRSVKEFEIASDLILISPEKRDALYSACGITRDPSKGTISGIVINENDQILAGAEVFITPSSGKTFYLDENGNPDFNLTKTGSSGYFVILNVEPRDYQLSATLSGYTFSPTITVSEDSITADALIGDSGSSDSPDGDSDSDGGGGGGGGSCFIDTASYRFRLSH